MHEELLRKTKFLTVFWDEEFCTALYPWSSRKFAINGIIIPFSITLESSRAYTWGEKKLEERNYSDLKKFEFAVEIIKLFREKFKLKYKVGEVCPGFSSNWRLEYFESHCGLWENERNALDNKSKSNFSLFLNLEGGGKCGKHAYKIELKCKWTSCMRRCKRFKESLKSKLAVRKVLHQQLFQEIFVSKTNPNKFHLDKL